MLIFKIEYEQTWIEKTLYYRFWLFYWHRAEYYPDLECRYNSYRTQVAWTFLVIGNGKKLEDSNVCGRVTGDDSDIEFVKIANIVPTKRYGVWKTALKMFLNEQSKEEVLDYLKTEAVAEVLSR